MQPCLQEAHKFMAQLFPNGDFKLPYCCDLLSFLRNVKAQGFYSCMMTSSSLMTLLAQTLGLTFKLKVIYRNQPDEEPSLN